MVPRVPARAIKVVPVAMPAVAPVAPPVYSTSTNGDRTDGDYIDPDTIDEVARSVFDVWLTSAGTAELAVLLADRPNIPQSIDRILLQDLVTRTGVYDIPTYARFGLRDAFWAIASAQ